MSYKRNMSRYNNIQSTIILFPTKLELLGLIIVLKKPLTRFKKKMNV